MTGPRLAIIVLACALAGCSSSKSPSTGPAPTGTVEGAVTSSLGGALSHVAVVVTPSGAAALATDSTGSAGTYAVSSVPVGSGSVAVFGVPNTCTAPAATPYANLTSGGTDTVNVVVRCVKPVGTMTGTVSSSLGGGISGVTVTVTPTGGSALAGVKTNTSGVYSVSSVPDGAGTVALSTLPSLCTTPNPTAYSGVTTGGSLMVNVPVTCVPPNGNLTVTITVPAGITPKVTVTGPNGYLHALSATATLRGLALGSYTVSAADTTVSDTIVNTVYSATIGGSPATVTSGGTTSATVSYGSGGTGRLWLANVIPRIIEGFPASDLRSSGTPSPDTLQTTSSPASLFSLAFDASGNAWAAEGGAIVEFSPAKLALGGYGTPITTITSTTISQPWAIAFDKSGSLWISDNQNYTIQKFTAAQLAAGGAQTPAVTISGSEISLPFGIAFDANGTLWVANQGSILGFTSAQLVTGTPTPITITTVGGLAGQNIYGVAFDASGNLWADAFSSVIEYTPSQLTTTGSPTPTTTVTLSSSGTTSAVFGAAFDNRGNMWLADFNRAQLIELSAAQLTAGGTQTPQVVIPVAMGLSSITSVAFEPHAPSLPLAGARVIRPRVHRVAKVRGHW